MESKKTVTTEQLIRVNGLEDIEVQAVENGKFKLVFHHQADLPVGHLFFQLATAFSNVTKRCDYDPEAMPDSCPESGGFEC